MFVKCDQVSTPLQCRRNPLYAVAPGGNGSHPVRGPKGVHFQVLVSQFAGDCQCPIGVVGCLRPIVRVEVDMAMGRDQRPGLAASVAELDGKLAGPFKGLQRLCNGRSMVEPDHIVGASEPQQRFHLLGRRALIRRLAHGKLEVNRSLAAAEQTEQQLTPRSQRGPSLRSRTGEFGRPAEESECFRCGEARGRRSTCLMQVLCGPLPSARLHEVVGEVAHMFIEVSGVNPFEGVGDTTVQALSAYE